MPFIKRDSEGNILGLWARPQQDGTEQLADEHPDVIGFRVRQIKPRARANIETAVLARLEAAVPTLERERAALLPDGDPAKVAALAAVEQAMVEQEVALAALAASTTAEEVEAVVQGVKE